MAKKEGLDIAMIGQKHIPSREGGVEVVVEELSTRMVKLGHRVTCYNRKGHHISGEQFDVVQLKEYKGVKLKYVFTINVKGLAAFTSSFCASIKAAFGNYDVVHFHAEGPCFFMWIPKLFGKKCIATIHGLDWQRQKWQGSLGAKFIKCGEKIAVRFADELIVLSESVKRYFLDTYGRNTVFIPNGITRPEILIANEISKKWGIGKDGYILFLGRIVPEKGITYLIEAYKRLETNKKLVIAGGSSDTEKFLNELRQTCNDDSSIIFTGFVEDQTLAELYSNAYLYVLPSDLEGMPLSLLEAMSYGNCCVVSNIPECVEVIEDKGVIFEKGNVDDLSVKLQILCDDKKTVERYKETASDYICKKYNWDDVTKETVEVYEKVCSTG